MIFFFNFQKSVFAYNAANKVTNIENKLKFNDVIANN